jgi:hypothetical protein
MWNVECGMWNVECGMWNVECGVGQGGLEVGGVYWELKNGIGVIEGGARPWDNGHGAGQ